MAPDELKPEYGKLLAIKQGESPYLVALSLGVEIGVALWIANHWPTDPIVLDAKAAEFQRSSEEDKVTETEAANIALALAESASVEPKDRIAALRLLAEMNGWIQKPQTVINNTNAQTIRPKVIKVREYATEADWEAASQRQQKDLLNVASTRH